MEYRAVLKDKGAVLRSIDIAAGDVRRQQVRGELDTVEVPLDGPGQCLDGLGLGQSRGAFHQQVTAGQQGHQQPLGQMVLADNMLVQVTVQLDKGFLFAHAIQLHVGPDAVRYRIIRRGIETAMLT